jgi:hypothetical protein
VTHQEFASVQTSMRIRKWDAGQTAYALRRADRDALGLLRQGRDVRVMPETFERYGVEPYETWFQNNVNAVLQAGWVALLGGIAGTSITTKYSATVGRIGVGDSTTALAWTQTGLQAATNKYYQLVSGAPVITTTTGPATLVFAATFGTGNGNFAWQEFVTDQGTSSGSGAVVAVCLNRGVVPMGTKASGQTWTATETIQFGFPTADGTVNDVGP